MSEEDNNDELDVLMRGARAHAGNSKKGKSKGVVSRSTAQNHVGKQQQIREMKQSAREAAFLKQKKKLAMQGARPKSVAARALATRMSKLNDRKSSSNRGGNAAAIAGVGHAIESMAVAIGRARHPSPAHQQAYIAAPAPPAVVSAPAESRAALKRKLQELEELSEEFDFDPTEKKRLKTELMQTYFRLPLASSSSSSTSSSSFLDMKSL